MIAAVIFWIVFLGAAVYLFRTGRMKPYELVVYITGLVGGTLMTLAGKSALGYFGVFLFTLFMLWELVRTVREKK
ncbi:hypothetical protein GI364_24010 [Alicyclobacillus sp. SO9]|nr:hypothetical protein GI364_24010 [Alicyclobacillus sp. SO9]